MVPAPALSGYEGRGAERPAPSALSEAGRSADAPGQGRERWRRERLWLKGAVSELLRSVGEARPPAPKRGAAAAAAALGPAGEAMAAPGPGAGAASGGASGGGAGAGAGSGSSGVGGRLPSRVLELVFSYLELSELRSCALVCKHWYRCLHGDENSEVWRSLCARSLAEEALRTDILCNLPSYKAKVRESRATSKPRSSPGRRSRGLPSKLESDVSPQHPAFPRLRPVSTTLTPPLHNDLFFWIEVLLRNPPHFLKY